MKDFKIPVIPSTTTKTIRLPNSVVEQVEKEIKGTNSNFTQFVVAAICAALENLEEQRQRGKGIETIEKQAET